MAKTKQIWVLAVLAIFILSLVPLGLADSANSVKGKASEVANAVSANVSAVVQKQNVEQHKEQYKDAKSNYVDAKKKLIDLQKEVKECKNNTDCEDKKKSMRNQTNVNLVKLSEVILSHLDNLKQKVEQSTDLNATEKTALLNSLQAQILEVQKTKLQIANVTSNVTDQEIKDDLKDLKTSWGKTKPHLQSGVGELANAKLGNIIVKVEQLETKFLKLRDQLKSKGYDVTKLDSYLEDLKEELASAEENWELAKAKFKSAKTATDPTNLIKEAHEYQKKALKDLSDTKEAIRDIVQEIKEQNKQLKNNGNETEIEE